MTVDREVAHLSAIDHTLNFLLTSGVCEVCGKYGWSQFSVTDPGNPNLYYFCAQHHKEWSQQNIDHVFMKRIRDVQGAPIHCLSRILAGFVFGLLILLLLLSLLRRFG